MVGAFSSIIFPLSNGEMLNKLIFPHFSILISKTDSYGTYLIKRLFNNCLLSTCYKPGSILSAEDSALLVGNGLTRNLKIYHGVRTIKKIYSVTKFYNVVSLIEKIYSVL